MRKHAALAILAPTIGWLVTSASAQDSRPFLVIGIGRLSCAHWLSTPANQAEGKAWLFGYWSGLNAGNPRDQMVGKNTDAEGIIGEVENVCRSHPSMSLGDATATAYMQMH